MKNDKYAVHVCINKNRPDLNADLKGCVNDGVNLRGGVLMDMFGFPPDNIRVLMDERATKGNIIDRLLWLVQHENSELVFHYSGHGSQVRDRNGDELDDGLDEILCPYDMDFDNPFTDDLLSDIFSTMPTSSFLTCIIDACHSGTMTRNIPNTMSTLAIDTVTQKFLTPPRDIQLRGEGRELKVKKIGSKSTLNHVLFSGCQDNQYSADAYVDNQWQGAFTSSLIKHIKPDTTWANIYPDVLKTLKEQGFSQTPCLTGREIETRAIFGGV